MKGNQGNKNLKNRQTHPWLMPLGMSKLYFNGPIEFF